jgi:hypothetical protein
MLRYIVSIGLAMTACAIFIPTKASAVTLTVEPDNIKKANPGDVITFTAYLDPEGKKTLTFLDLLAVRKLAVEPILRPFLYDPEELEFIEQVAEKPFKITERALVATFKFLVLEGVKKDGKSDLSHVTVLLHDSALGAGLNGNVDEVSNSDVDVVPPDQLASVPEPLTMFGAAAALGYGAILKRKYSKKTES